MLKQNVSFTAPNRYLGSTDWIREWTPKAHEFRQKACRFVYGSPAVCGRLGISYTAAGCREEVEDSDACGVAPHFEMYRFAAQLVPGAMLTMLANQATVNFAVAHLFLLIIALSAMMRKLLQQA